MIKINNPKHNKASILIDILKEIIDILKNQNLKDDAITLHLGVKAHYKITTHNNNIIIDVLECVGC